METRLPTKQECEALAKRFKQFRWLTNRIEFDLGNDTYSLVPGSIPLFAVWHNHDERAVCSAESFLAALTAKCESLLMGFWHKQIWHPPSAPFVQYQYIPGTLADADQKCYSTAWAALLATEEQSDGD